MPSWRNWPNSSATCASDQGIPGAARERPYRGRTRAPARRARRQIEECGGILARPINGSWTIDPFDAAAHTGLGRIAMKKNQPAVAVREFTAAMALRPADRASAHCDLGEALLAAGRAGRGEAGSSRGARARSHLRARAGTAARLDQIVARRGSARWPTMTRARQLRHAGRFRGAAGPVSPAAAASLFCGSSRRCWCRRPAPRSRTGLIRASPGCNGRSHASGMKHGRFREAGS